MGITVDAAVDNRIAFVIKFRRASSTWVNATYRQVIGGAGGLVAQRQGTHVYANPGWAY